MCNLQLNSMKETTEISLFYQRLKSKIALAISVYKW